MFNATVGFPSKGGQSMVHTQYIDSAGKCGHTVRTHRASVILCLDLEPSFPFRAAVFLFYAG